jgi:hypothetical protein
MLTPFRQINMDKTFLFVLLLRIEGMQNTEFEIEFYYYYLLLRKRYAGGNLE